MIEAKGRDLYKDRLTISDSLANVLLQLGHMGVEENDVKELDEVS